MGKSDKELPKPMSEEYLKFRKEFMQSLLAKEWYELPKEINRSGVHHTTIRCKCDQGEVLVWNDREVSCPFCGRKYRQTIKVEIKEE